jgi:hypothetical protein
VHDAGVVGRLVERELRLLLQHEHVGVRPVARDQARRREAEDPASDDYDPHGAGLSSRRRLVIVSGSVTPSSRRG